MREARRREFLKLSAATVGALALGSDALAQGLGERIPNPFRVHARQVAFDDDVTTTYSYCENCFWKCGVKASVSGGKVRKVDGYDENPKSRGMLCPRGQGAVAQTYDPDRLKMPLIRVEGSARGDGRYREASWDEALDYIAEKMQGIKTEYGTESVAFFGHGSATPGSPATSPAPGAAPTPPSPRSASAPARARPPASTPSAAASRGTSRSTGTRPTTSS